MTAAADTLFVGGNFTSIGTMNRTRIAAFDLATLQLRSWSSSVNAAPEVLASSATKNVVYLGGTFITVGGLPRNRIAAISATEGSVLPWNPNAAGAVRALAVMDDTIYAGGVFTSIGGQNRNRIAALDAATGQATSWNPNANGAVESILVASESSPHRLFVGGAFSQIGDGGRLLAAELDVATGTATGWHPRASGLALVATAAVTTLVKSGETLFLGGSFRSLGGAVRNNIAALDRISGAATIWNPDADGVVMALAHSPNGIYAGGTFIKMGGVERNRAALIGLGSGQPLSWNPNLTISSTQIPSVQSIAVTSTQVFLGGLFQRVGGTVRPHLAAVEPVGGQLIAWNPAMTFSANVTVSSLLLANDLLYVGGAFGAIGGQTRANLAALSPTTALATAWNPSANAAVDVIVLHPSGLHAGGRFTRVGGQLRNLVAGLDTATGLATGWDAAAPGTVASRVYGLGFLAGRIHVGGQFATIGGQNRARLGQLETSIGQATDWNPSVDNICRVIQTVPEGVFVGGDFTTVNGAPHGYFVVFPNRPIFPSGSSKFTPPGSFQSAAPGGEGGPRSIQASEDGGRTWRDIDVVWAADGFAFTDPEADLASSRFYRAVLHVAP